MVAPSSLEVICDAYVKVRVGILGGSFVDDVSPVALPVEGEVFLPRGLAAPFFSRGGFLFLLFLQYYLLCPCIILLMLAVQLYEILRVFLFNIGYNLWCLGKCLLTRSKIYFQI